MIEALLGDKFGELTSALTGNGFSTDQANAFIPEAAQGFLETFKAHGEGLDLNDLGGSASSLLQSFDISSLAEKVGISAEQAQTGVSAVLPTLLSLAGQHQDKIEMLSSMLGGKGGLGGIFGGLTSKLFGK